MLSQSCKNVVLGLSFALSVLVAVQARAEKPADLSPQTISLPDGPTSLKGLGESFSPNLSTGTGNFSVPIQLAPAILQPKVSLNYSAGTGKSELGISFRLPVLNVYRTTDKGLPQFTEEDNFSVSGPSLNDELVPVDESRQIYRLKNEGAFALFERNPTDDSWLIKMPDGKQAHLGISEQSRQGNGRGTYRWYLQSYQDPLDHEVRYLYKHDHRHVYLEEIQYQLHASAGYQNKVKFTYETRPDPYTDYSYGRPETTSMRLSCISVLHGERLLRTYHLEYDKEFLYSLLRKVTMEAEHGFSMEPLTFGYLKDTTTSGRFVTMTSTPPLEGLLNGSASLEDINGDALPDILYGEAGNYYYYENLDGLNWSPIAKQVTGDPDRALFQPDVVMADINGDGFRDIVYAHEGDFRYFPAGDIKDGVFRGFGEPVILRATGLQGLHFGSRQVKLTDLNHDGRTDWLVQDPGSAKMVLNHQDDRMEVSTIPRLPIDVDFTDPNVQLMDFNGDGILDFVKKEISYQSARMRVWFGVGFGEYLDEIEMRNVPKGGADEYYLQDVNKDGQCDLVRVSGSWVKYYLNNGDMRYVDTGNGYHGMPSTSRTRKVLFGDMNGNGTTDVVWLTADYKLKYLDLRGQPHAGMLSQIDNGMGLVTTFSYRSSTEYMVEAKKKGEAWKTPMPFSVPILSELSTTDSFDLLGFEATLTQKEFEYRDGYYDGEEGEFRGFAQVKTIEYGDEYHESKVTQTHMHVGRNLQTQEDEEILKGKTWLQLVEDLQGNLYTSTQTKWERRWMCQEDLGGISQRILPDCEIYPDKDKNKDHLVAYAVQTQVLRGSFEKTSNPRFTGELIKYDIWGRPRRTEKYGEVLLHGAYQLGQPFDLSTLGGESLTYGEDESYQEIEYINDIDRWFVGLVYQESILDGSGAIQSQTRKYYDGAAFEGLPLGQVGEAGLVTREEAWLAPLCTQTTCEEGRWIDAKRSSYNSHGLLSAKKDANDNLIEIEYDQQTNTNPTIERVYVDDEQTGQLTPLVYEASYDTGFGVIVTATDYNGNQTAYFYDGLGRVERVVDPHSSYDTPTLKYKYEYATSHNPVSTTTIQQLISRQDQTYRTTYQYTDGAGRTRLTKVEAEEPYGFIASGWSRFSPRGKETHVFDPFSSLVLGFEAAPSDRPVTVRYFDALDRKTEEYPPDTDEYEGTYSLTRYLPFETQVYDERDTSEETWSYPAITRVDGLGRIREIIRYNDYFTGEGLEQEVICGEIKWQVEYDTLGNIVGFIDPQRNRRSYGYDSLGRMLTVDDRNIGHVDYDFDDVGNLIRREDSLGQVRQFVYGAASRLKMILLENDPHGRPDYSYSYHYDHEKAGGPLVGSTNLLGKVAWVAWPTGESHFSFDELGRMTSEVQEIWNPSISRYTDQIRDAYRQDFAYDAAGNVVSKALPGGLHVDYHYNERSLVNSVRGGFEDNRRSIFPKVTYDQRGSPLVTGSGNYVTTCNWYDNRGQLQGMLSGPSERLNCGEQMPGDQLDHAFQFLRYHRTETGLIKKIDDLSKKTANNPSLDAQYHYDRLYQLVSATTSQGEINYAYDSIQNLIQRTSNNSYINLPTGIFGYGENEAGPNQITTAGDSSFTYDAVGQMMQYKGYDLIFDVEGRLVQATHPVGTTIDYYYDDSGNKKLTIINHENKPPEIIRYIFDNYRIKDGDEIWFVTAGQGKAEINSSKGIEPDLNLLHSLVAYYNNPEGTTKPIPVEYLDINEDGKDQLDRNDVAAAVQAYWTNERVGGEKRIWRYYHRDNLTSSTHVSDSAGDPVAYQQYHPFGKTFHRRGMQPIHGFAGSEIESAQDLGLVRFGARWYAPDIGRWISGDLFVLENPKINTQKTMESSLYVYVANEPIDTFDPTGKLGLVGAGVGAVIGGAGGALIELGRQVLSGEEINGRKIAASAAGGVLSGAIAGATGGASLLLELGGGLVAGASGGMLNRGLDGDDNTEVLDGEAILFDSAAGVISAGATRGARGLVKNHPNTKIKADIAQSQIDTSPSGAGLIARAKAEKSINTLTNIAESSASAGTNVVATKIKPTYDSFMSNSTNDTSDNTQTDGFSSQTTYMDDPDDHWCD